MVYTPHPQDSGAGHSHFTLVFTNVGTDACTLDGYPGLVAIDADGGVLGDHAGQMTTGQDQPVLLAAEGGSADVEVLFTSAGVYGCTVVTAYGLRAYLPGTGDGIFAAAAIPVCERNVSLFSVGPFRTPRDSAPSGAGDTALSAPERRLDDRPRARDGDPERPRLLDKRCRRALQFGLGGVG
jgi:hypothetical protein